MCKMEISYKSKLTWCSLRKAEHSQYFFQHWEGCCSSGRHRWSSWHASPVLFICNLFLFIFPSMYGWIRVWQLEYLANGAFTAHREHLYFTCSHPPKQQMGVETDYLCVLRTKYCTLHVTGGEFIYLLKKINTLSPLSYSSALSSVTTSFKLAEYELNRSSGGPLLGPARLSHLHPDFCLCLTFFAAVWYRTLDLTLWVSTQLEQHLAK